MKLFTRQGAFQLLTMYFVRIHFLFWSTLSNFRRAFWTNYLIGQNINKESENYLPFDSFPTSTKITLGRILSRIQEGDANKTGTKQNDFFVQSENADYSASISLPWQRMTFEVTCSYYERSLPGRLQTKRFIFYLIKKRFTIFNCS